MRALLKQRYEYSKANLNIRAYLGVKCEEKFYKKYRFVLRLNKDLCAGMIIV